MLKIKMANIIFYFLFILLIIVAVITPHIFHGYGILTENYVQLFIILFDIILAGALYSYYARKLEKIARVNQTYERRLIQSYKYIGKVHSKIELLNNFMDNIRQYKEVGNKKQIFANFLSFMLVSVVKVNEGLLRFIDIKKGRTLKDFIFCQNDKCSTIKLSNSEIIKGDLEKASEKNFLAVKSDLDLGGLKCVLTFPKTNSQPDLKLLKTLLNQAHLFFITTGHETQNL